MSNDWKKWTRGLVTSLVTAVTTGAAPLAGPNGHFSWTIFGLALTGNLYHYIQQSPLPNIPALEAAAAQADGK